MFYFKCVKQPIAKSPPQLGRGGQFRPPGGAELRPGHPAEPWREKMWKTMWNIWEQYGKHMGKPCRKYGQNYGENVGNPQENRGLANQHADLFPSKRWNEPLKTLDLVTTVERAGFDLVLDTWPGLLLCLINFAGGFNCSCEYEGDTPCQYTE